MTHISVLLKEVIEYLDPKPNENFVDGTVGQGGHTVAILEKTAPEGKVLAIELDPEIYQELESNERLIAVNDSYVNLKEILEEKKFGPVNGILLDLGVSSYQLDEAKRGFSFREEQVLDMRFNPEKTSLTAEEIVNNWPEKELEKIFEEYGEEKFARKIAKAIITERPIKTTTQLAKIVQKIVKGKQRIHPATRIFQALRIAVNGELDNLKTVLNQIVEILPKGARVVIISFHSLEDRIVKNFFRESDKLEILTKKPVIAGEEEIKNNRRSRSAKLRAAEIK